MKRTVTVAAAALLAVGALSLSIAGEKKAATPHEHEKPAMEAVINEKDIQTASPTTAETKPTIETTANTPTPASTANEPTADAADAGTDPTSAEMPKK